MTETCPNCRELTLKIVNVMSSTQTYYYHCAKCGFRGTQRYNKQGTYGIIMSEKGTRQSTLI